MPQIQVIPAAQQRPGFGSQLGAALGGGLSQGLSAGLAQMLEQKKKTAETDRMLSSLGIKMPTEQKDTRQKKGVQALDSLQTDQSTSGSAGLELTPEKVFAVATINPQVGNTLATLYQSQQAQREKREAADEERSRKYLDVVEDIGRTIPERRIALNTAEQAARSGEMTPFGGDFWGDILHLPQLKTASGSALATAAKTNLISTLSRVSGKAPNMYLDKQVIDAFPSAGATKENMLAQTAIARGVLDIEEKQVETVRALAEDYRAKTGRVPADLEAQAYKLNKQFNLNRTDKIAYDIQNQIESSQNKKQLQEVKHVTKGTPLTAEKYEVLKKKAGSPEKAIILAEKLGYQIAKSENLPPL